MRWEGALGHCMPIYCLLLRAWRSLQKQLMECATLLLRRGDDVMPLYCAQEHGPLWNNRVGAALVTVLLPLAKRGVAGPMHVHLPLHVYRSCR